MKVLISTSSFAADDRGPLEILATAGIEAVMPGLGRTLKVDEVGEWAAGCDGIIAGTEPLPAHILRSLNGLKVISRVGVGLDNIDLEEAEKLGIKVYNTPDGPTTPVAELTVALILDLLRGVSRADAEMRSGRWHKRMGRLLRGKVVGVIGFGRIGRLVASLVQAFGSRVIACDVCPDHSAAAAIGVTMVEMNELLSRADIVTLHTSGCDSLIGADELALLKPGAFLINASRGGLVDEAALYGVLKSGRLAGAALDTFGAEPYDGPLTELSNVVLSPHVGSYAVEARVAMETQAAKNMVAGLLAAEGARIK